MSARGLAVAVLVVVAAILGGVAATSLWLRASTTTITSTVTVTSTLTITSAYSETSSYTATTAQLAGSFREGSVGAALSFKSVDDLRVLIEAYVKRSELIYRAPVITIPTVTPLGFEIAGSLAPKEGGVVIPPNIPGPRTLEAMEYSVTNVRAPGVDEDDVVKCDGKYLYVVSRNRRKVYIVDAYPAENMSVARTLNVARDLEELIGNVTLKAFYNGQEVVIAVLKPSITVQGIYAYKGLVAVIAYARLSLPYAPWYPLRSGETVPGATVLPVMYGQTWILVYNATSGELVRRYWVSGWFQDSRMINGTVYLVTRLPTAYLPIKEPVPCTADGPLPVESIGYIGGWPETYTIISAYNLETGDRGALALLGPQPSIMYMTPTGRIYVTMNAAWYRILPLVEKKIEIRDVKGLAEAITEAQKLGWDETLILKVKVNGVELSLDAKAVVKGRVPHVFAIDEYKGYLRVVSQVFGEEMNVNLYVLDADSLELVGKLEGISPRERIHGVRFMGDKVYLVTFRQIDPLFTIDLSDPEHPRIIGYLKGPGFDEYLHPLPGNLILGIGREDWKVRVTTYQITSNGSLVPVSKIVLENTTWTPVLDTRKGYRALVVNPKDHYILLPANLMKPILEQQGTAAYVRYKTLQGVYVITWTPEGKLGAKGFVEHPGAVRAAYIDDVCYAISMTSIKAFNETTLQPIKTLELLK